MAVESDVVMFPKEYGNQASLNQISVRDMTAHVFGLQMVLAIEAVPIGLLVILYSIIR